MVVALALLLAQTPIISSPAQLPVPVTVALRSDGGFFLAGTLNGNLEFVFLSDQETLGPFFTVSGFDSVGSLYLSGTKHVVVGHDDFSVVRWNDQSRARTRVHEIDAGLPDGGLPLLGPALVQAVGAALPDGGEAVAFTMQQSVFENPLLFEGASTFQRVGHATPGLYCGVPATHLAYGLLPQNRAVGYEDRAQLVPLGSGASEAIIGRVAACTPALSGTLMLTVPGLQMLTDAGLAEVRRIDSLFSRFDLPDLPYVDMDFDGQAVWVLWQASTGLSGRRYSLSGSPIDAVPFQIMSSVVEDPQLTVFGPGRGLLTYELGGQWYQFLGVGRLGDPCTTPDECASGACASSCVRATSGDAGTADAGASVDAGLPDAGGADASIDAGALDGGVAADGGGSEDAGSSFDAGLTDAGLTDAGSSFDAGPADAGLTDAGSSFDAGPTDAGSGADAGTDAGLADAGLRVDGGTDADGGLGNEPYLVACGCQSAGDSWLLVALLAALRRRR